MADIDLIDIENQYDYDPGWINETKEVKIKGNKMTTQSELEIKKMMEERGLNAPSISPELIDEIIKDEYYHIVPSTTLTICVLTLQNGFTVTGESAAASKENFNEEIGRKIARENAREKIWKLEGYLLREKLYQESVFTVLNNVPDTPNWDNTQFSKELDEAIEKGFSKIKTSDGNKYQIINRNSVKSI